MVRLRNIQRMAEHDDKKGRDIRDVFSEESSRSRKASRNETVRKREQSALAKELLEAIRSKDERKFSYALKRAGIREDSEEWQNAWKAYRASVKP
jgi:hypothetical protein